MSDLPRGFEDYAAFGVYAAYSIDEFVPGGTLDFVCWQLDSLSYLELYRIPGTQGTCLPADLRDGDEFRPYFEPTPFTALQECRRFPPDAPGRSIFEYAAEINLQCFALNTALVEQARAENRVRYIHDISPLPSGENYTGQQWGAVDYYEKYPKPLYDIRYDGTPIALINADHYTLSDDGHHLTVHHDFFSWRVWINGTTQWIKDAFTISPPIFTLTAPGTITVTETHDMYIEKPLGWDEATEY